MRRVVLAVVSVLALAALLVGGLLYETILWFNLPSRERFPVRGIDVSHHQGAIDWAVVAGEGFRFAWIKATEGGDWKDPGFDQNWKGARAAGVVPGAYHFFTFCRPPAVQAANFLATLPIEPDSLPPVVDVEFGGNCPTRPSDLRRDVDVFADAVEAALGRRPLVYTTRETLDAYPLNGPFWMRDVFREPPPPWTVWQYGYDRHVKGIDGLVDVNVFDGTEEEFEAFVSAPGIVSNARFGTAKLSPHLDIDLTLANPAPEPRWFLLADRAWGKTVPSDGVLVQGEPQMVQWDVLHGEGEGEASVFEVGVHAVRVAARSFVTLTDFMPAGTEGVWRIEIAVANDVTADGEPLEARFPESASDPAVRARWGYRRAGYDDEEPAAVVRAWERRVNRVEAHVRTDWILEMDPTQTRWIRCDGPSRDPACAPPEQKAFVGPIDAEMATRVSTLPDDELLAWLRANRKQVLASTSGASAWQLAGNIVLLVLEGGKRRVTMWNSVAPVASPWVAPNVTESYWAWREGWDVKDGTLVRGQGGALVLRADGWRSLEPPKEKLVGLNGSGPPHYLDGEAALDGPVGIKGAMAPEVVAQLVDEEAVRLCYVDTRSNGPGGVAQLEGGFPANDVLYRPGGEPLLMGHVDIDAVVAADGTVLRAGATGLPSRRLAACLARYVPRRWKLAASWDGRPYTVRTTWLLAPAE